jgi:hypothetical protein
MKTIRTILAAATLAMAALCTSAGADHTTPAATLLYLDQQGWEQAGREAKIALASDFMRVFCGNPAMPAADLAGCLDRSDGPGSLFERALTCVGAPASHSR